jgi:hypothetical protein
MGGAYGTNGREDRRAQDMKEKCKGTHAPGRSKSKWKDNIKMYVKEIGWSGAKWINPLNTELNPICHLLALLGTHHILHVSRVRVNLLRDDRLYEHVQ